MRRFVKAVLCLLVIAMAFAWSAPAAGGERRAAAQFWPRDGWQPFFSSGGFGKRTNSAAMPIVEFEGKLYAGAADGSGAQVYVRDGAAWTRSSDFDSAANVAVMRMVVFKGRLYAGTAKMSGGCELWRYDGTAWEMIEGNGFDDPGNLAISAMIEYKEELYIGLTNYNLSTLSTAGAGVKRSADGDNWVDANSAGLADSPLYNVGIGAFEVYDNNLYATTVRMSLDPWPVLFGLPARIQSQGFQVWRTSGGPACGWSRLADNGISDTRNLTALDMAVYGGRLYIATANGDAEVAFDIATMRATDFSFASSGLCVYSYDGTSFEETVRGGFNTAEDALATSLTTAVCGGKTYLLAGVASGDSDGAVSRLIAFDGTTWEPAAPESFGVPGNLAVTALLSRTEGSTPVLYAGTANGATGCEVWRLDLTQPVRAVWYLAEGSTDWGFHTYVTIQNPNHRPLPVRVTYMTPSGPRARPDLTLPARSQTVINPLDDIGATDFSTRVECLEAGLPVAVDRRMLWRGPGAASQEGHASIGVTCPATAWYLPEGSSKWGFETWVCIQNPNSRAATCRLTYMIEGRGPQTFTKRVEARSRGTFNMYNDIGSEDASVEVRANMPVIPERAMYRNNRRGGHASVGTTVAARDYYLAEGTTDHGFTTYVEVQNPRDAENTVSLTYMTTAGPITRAPFTMPAKSRKTIRVNDDLAGRDLSIKVSGSLPLVAERAMYWDGGAGEACHGSVGMSSAHSTFYLPDGETWGGHETWTCVQNANPVAVEVEVTYMTPTGVGNVTFRDAVAADARETYSMADRIPSGRAAILVRCVTPGRKVMCERAMYWNSRGAGTATIGGYSD